jgi:hypothetical protein
MNVALQGAQKNEASKTEHNRTEDGDEDMGAHA